MNEDRDLLRVDGLEKKFGGLTALSDYSVRLAQGRLMGLIGPNGAGKTTVFNLLSGVLRPSRGRIILGGEDITGLRPDQTAARGVARTFQNIRLFNELSVMDNIKVAFHMKLGSGFWPTVFHTPRYIKREREIHDRTLSLLELMHLAEIRHEFVKNLPYGEQRRVEIIRALAASPKLLLLDEPAAGMNPHETDELVSTISRIHQDYSLTVLLVEHDMSVVMSICERIQVLDQGRLLCEGYPDEIQNDPRVIEAYLGAPRHAQA